MVFNTPWRLLWSALFGICVFVANSPSAELPNTKPLTDDGDLAAKQVAGMHKYLDREMAAAPAKRDALWKANTAEPLAAKRQRLRKILGLVDARVPPKLEYVGGPGNPSLVREVDGIRIHRVRWAVLPGLNAEGFLIEPRGEPKANIVLLYGTGPAAEVIPGIDRAVLHGCRVLIPTQINRDDVLSANPRLNKQTNIPHREFVYRMAFEMGRTLIGYEVQQVLAAVDWFTEQNPKLKIGVVGYGDGGMVAFYAGALDDRIHTTAVAQYFGPRESLHAQPIDRNVWGLLNEFGDAEIARLHNYDHLHLMAGPTGEAWPGPKPAQPGRGGAAPGTIPAISVDREFIPEELRIRGKSKIVGPRDNDPMEKDPLVSLGVWIDAEHHRLTGLKSLELTPKRIVDPDYADRHQRQFDQLVAHVQKLWRDSEATRKTFWAKADMSSPEAWDKSCGWYRDYFHSEVIGKLPEPTMPLNPRSRQVYDETTWTGHEVMLDIYPDVFAYGIVLLPKGMKPGEKRPVVVCQHGLEGTPRSTIDAEMRPVYDQFSKKLAEQGYIVFAPQNPYYGRNDFRQLQRKANPLKLSIFSFIIRQHQRILDWLETLPNVDSKRIGFYGLSYGGKTAMRVPAVEKRYCLSICSGDFNEWIGKNVSIDLDRSYMWTGEYEMYEFDLGNTFNYAEMAYLIAPRPFMVERGHDDGVGTDEMVSYEYAKVRYLYANRLKIADRTEIEYQPGGHRIFGQGTYAFLAKHLNWMPK